MFRILVSLIMLFFAAGAPQKTEPKEAPQPSKISDSERWSTPYPECPPLCGDGD